MPEGVGGPGGEGRAGAETAGSLQAGRARAPPGRARGPGGRRCRPVGLGPRSSPSQPRRLRPLWWRRREAARPLMPTSLVAAQGSCEASDAEPRAEPCALGFHSHSSLEERRHLNSDRLPTAAAPLLRCRCCSPPTHGAAAAVHSLIHRRHQLASIAMRLIHRRRHQLASIAMRRKYPRGSGSHARRATLPCLCSASRCCATLCAAARRSVQGSRG